MWTVQWALKSYWYGRGLQLAGGNFSNVTLEDISQADVANMLLCERLHRPANWQPKKMHVLQEVIDFKQYLFRSYWKSIRRALKAVQNGKPWRTCRASAFCFATTVFAMQFFNALASNAKIWKGCWHWTMHGLYLRTLLLQSRMQADSVILPISNVAQTTQTLSSLSKRF